jgi:phosphoglycerol transferase MdoB-like AlkP superfamily enzyme
MQRSPMPPAARAAYIGLGRDGGKMPTWYIGAGLCFFAAAVIAALFLVALAPLGTIRLLGVIATVCATAGVALHLYAMRVDDPRALTALRQRLYSMLTRMQTA